MGQRNIHIIDNDFLFRSSILVVAKSYYWNWLQLNFFLEIFPFTRI